MSALRPLFPHGCFFFGPLKLIVFKDKATFLSRLGDAEMKALIFPPASSFMELAVTYESLELVKTFKLDFPPLKELLILAIDAQALRVAKYLLGLYSLLNSRKKDLELCSFLNYQLQCLGDREPYQRWNPGHGPAGVLLLLNYLFEKKAYDNNMLETLFLHGAYYGNFAFFSHLSSLFPSYQLNKPKFLIKAILGGNPKIVEFLLKVNKANALSKKALRVAASNDNVEALKLLVSYGAVPDETTMENAVDGDHYLAGVYLQSLLPYDQGAYDAHIESLINNGDLRLLREFELKGYILKTEETTYPLNSWNLNNFNILKFFISTGFSPKFFESILEGAEDDEYEQGIKSFSQLLDAHKEARAKQFLRTLYIKDLLAKI